MFKNIKIRCSDIHHIMTGTTSRGLTEKQTETLNELIQKEKRTDKQAELMNELIEKRDAPPTLSKTTINYLKEVVLEMETGRSQEIQTDAMYRGIVNEVEAIEMLNYITLSSYHKNKLRFENEYITGEPDIFIEGRKLRDIKASQDIFTHPWYEKENPNPAYFYQMQGYMWLTGANVAYLDYILLDAPEWWLQRKLKNKHFDLIDKGLEGAAYDIEYEKYELELRFNYTYQDLPNNRRLKTFKIERSETTIQKIKEQIELIRQFSF